MLRTDRARLRPLTQDSDATVTLRLTVRARQDLVRARVAMANQLRAHLQTTLPGAIGLFRDTGLLMPRSVLAGVPGGCTGESVRAHPYSWRSSFRTSVTTCSGATSCKS